MAPRTHVAVVMLLVSGIIGTGVSSAAAPTFTVVTEAGGNGGGTAVADFDGDGDDDLALTDGPANLVRLFLNDGHADLTAGATLAASFAPQDLVAADVDGDNDQDLAVTSSSAADVISIFKNNGSGTFAASGSYTAGDGSTGIAAVNFDGDSDIDFASANGLADTVTLATNDGTGVLTTTTYTFGFSADPDAIAGGDITGDGKQDLAVAGSALALFVLPGNGDGTFGAPVGYAMGSAPRGVIVADLNGDGDLDAATSNLSGDSVSVRLNDGSGSLGGAADVTHYAVSDLPQDLVAVDLDDDNDLDLGVAAMNGIDVNPGHINTLLNDGDGTFTAGPTANVGNGPESLSAGLFNNDDNPDLVTAAFRSDDISIALNSPAADLSLDPTSHDFGNQPVGTTSGTQEFELSNDGSLAADIESITASSDFSVASEDCPATLNPAGSCEIDVDFTPTAAGAATGTLSVALDEGGPIEASLSGTGTAPAVTLAPGSINFGDQLVGTTSPEQTIVVTNTGNATLTLSSITASGDYSEDASDCGATLAASDSCDVDITFAPTAPGARNGTLSVVSDASTSPDEASLTGNGTQPEATATPATVSFGSHVVGVTSSAQTVTVTNSGTAPLTVSGVALTGAHTGDFAIGSDDCTAETLAPSDDCEVDVTFTASAVGTRSATLQVSSDDPASPDDVSLLGNGVAVSMPIEVSPGTINFMKTGVVTVEIPTNTVAPLATIVVSSICFGDAEAPAQRDCTETHRTGHLKGGVLTLHYEMKQSGIDRGDTMACLTGRTTGGIVFEGCDTVRVI